MASALDEREVLRPKPATFPVSERDQLRNVVLFGINTALYFLASPVLNVGRLQAAICKSMGASDTVSNLPGSAYLVMAASPVFVACVFPQVSLLKRLLVVCYSALALTGALVVVVLCLPVPNFVKIFTVILQGGLTGAALVTATTFMFEVLGHGTEESKRGRALSLGYGRGPVLGLLAALCLQLLLEGKLFGLTVTPIPAPWNFAIPFAASVPIMGLAAWLSTQFVIAPVAVEQTRQPLITSVFTGLVDFLSDRVMLVVTIIGVLSHSGITIGNNMTLYTKEVLGVAPETLVGYQLALRFGFKIASGLFLGWLLARTSQRATMFASGMFGLCGVVWAMAAAGNWFLLSFGLLGAGELFGVYQTNYILSRSSPTNTRRNMVFASLMMCGAAPAGALFGSISDHFGRVYSHAFGFRVSFAVAAAVLGLVILFTFLIPAKPKPQAQPDGRY